MGKNEKSVEYNKLALDIAKEIGDKRKEGNILGNLGSLYITIGDYTTSLSYNNEAMQIAIDIGDKRREGIILGNIGIVYSYLGEYDNAVECYHRSVEISKRLEETRRRKCGWELRTIQYARKKEKAKEHFRKAIQIFKEIGDKQREGAYLGFLPVYQDLESLKIKKTVHRGDVDRYNNRQQTQCRLLGNLGNLYKACGDPEEARSHYLQAIEIFREIVENELNDLGIRRPPSNVERVEKRRNSSPIHRDLQHYNSSGSRALRALRLCSKQ